MLNISDEEYNINKFELAIILNNNCCEKILDRLLKKSDSKDKIMNQLKIKTVISSILLENETIYKNVLKNISIKEQKYIGKGFNLIYDRYKTSNIIIDFYIKEYLNKLFGDYNTISEIIHTNFISKEDAKGKLNKVWLISYISRYDNSLGLEVSKNTDYLSNIIIEFNRAISEWDEYNRRKETENLYEMFKSLVNYYEKYEEEFKLNNLYSIISYILVKYNLVDKINKNKLVFDLVDGLGPYKLPEIDVEYEEIDDISKLDSNNFENQILMIDNKEIIHINTLEEIVKKYMCIEDKKNKVKKINNLYNEQSL